MKPTELKSYTSTFVSYLIRKLNHKTNEINRIILYGSVAKGEANKKSDVDLFIDTQNQALEKKIKKVVSDFYNTREAAFFKIKGITNKFSLKVGELKKWKELHRSISSSGWLLWGRYETKEKPIGTNHKILFYWEEIRKNRGAFLNKLYGYRSKGQHYLGLLDKIGGIKTGKSSILIPIKNREELIYLFKKYQVKAKQKEDFT